MEVGLRVVHLHQSLPFLGDNLETVDRVRGVRGDSNQNRVQIHRGHLGGGVLRKAAASAIDLTERRVNRIRPINTRDTVDQQVSVQVD